jgi:DNA helicase-2/ATP-dependent DNA helicase PcrA
MSRVIPGITEESLRRAQNLVSHVENLTEAARRETPLRMLQLVLDKTGYLGTIMKLPEADKIEAIRVLNGLADRLRRYEAATRAPTLRGFMEEFRLEIESGEEGALNADPNEGPDLVRVLTIHASKGLEFRHVFIVSLVDQRFPTRVRKDAIPLPDGLINERLPDGDAHLEEERRLFYVAMTRAKETVTLTGAESYGGTRQKKPSIFLSELNVDPAALLPQETTSLISLTPPTPLSVEDFLEDQDVFPLKRRFSFTQLAAFQSCPLQYKFAHVYKIPILGSFQKSFGNCIHLTLEEILKQHLERGVQSQGDLFTPVAPIAPGFRVSLEEALKMYESRWAENDDWYESKGRYDEYYAKGKEAIKRLMQEWIATPPNVEFLERPFDWSVGEHSLRGKVDRLDRLPTGGYGILDYKTGSAKTEDTVDTKDKEQLWIYQMAMEEMGLSITRLSYVYVLSGETLDVELLQGEKREAFRDRIAKRMNEILLSRFAPIPSTFTCRYCDFRSICEHREL